MEVLEKKDFNVNRFKSFSTGFLKAYDIFGITNKYKDVKKVGDLKTYNYKDGFKNTGNSLRKYIFENK